MRLEILAAVDFLVRLLRNRSGQQLTEKQLKLFKFSLIGVLRRRYRRYWDPNHPNRGTVYRSIRINNKLDPAIAQACADVGLRPCKLHKLFPRDLVVWIDPFDVCYQIGTGDAGSIGVLYEQTESDPEEIEQMMLKFASL